MQEKKHGTYMSHRAFPNSGVVENFLLWESLHGISHRPTLSLSLWWEGGGGCQNECYLSMVKIHLQTWKHGKTFSLRCRLVRNVGQFYCSLVRGMLFRVIF